MTDKPVTDERRMAGGACEHGKRITEYCGHCDTRPIVSNPAPDVEREWAVKLCQAMHTDVGQITLAWARGFIRDFSAALSVSESRDAWALVEAAPHAMHVLAARFDEAFGEWIYGVVLSPPSHPFTHWQMLPQPPLTGGQGCARDAEPLQPGDAAPGSTA